jgi:2-polyprenyl-3-methyl-5-hydroxy-6-metoxy-1,4-benzoquinol methylase
MTNRSLKKVLLLIVDQNAEWTLASVLGGDLSKRGFGTLQILVIHDQLRPSPLGGALQGETQVEDPQVLVLHTGEPQGLGGSQKLGFHYAIENGFDKVVLVPAGGFSAAEDLPTLLAPLLNGDADVNLGFELSYEKAKDHAGLSLLDWSGNQIFTRFQNFVLGTQFSALNSGYRSFNVDALKRIPFERNSNDFRFDTELFLQLHYSGARIQEVQISADCGNKPNQSHSFRNALRVCASVLCARLHQMDLLYERKFDLGNPELNYDLKLGFASSHTAAIQAVKPGATVLDIGCGQGLVAAEMAKRAARVVGLDQYVKSSGNPEIEMREWNLDSDQFPVNANEFDQIFLLDVIEHLKEPELFMENLRAACLNKRPEIILTTANVAFIFTRLMLLFGRFSYSRKGILDRTHTRLFTFHSLCQLFEQTGYQILEVRGIPAPFPKILGNGWLGRFSIWMNQLGIGLFRGLFSYQIYVRALASPRADVILSQLVKPKSCERKRV